MIVLWFAQIPLGIFGGFNRYSLILKIQSLSHLLDQPRWKVWRLSAIEPVVTTIVGFIWLYIQIVGGVGRVNSLHIVSQMSILLFMVWIWVVGKGCQRARLTISVLFLRLCFLSIPLIALFIGIQPEHNDEITTVGAASLILAFVTRALFGIYQNRVTPERTELEQTQTEEDIILGRREIEDGVALIDELELWNEQVALIERLKAGEVTVDQLVAENDGMVGRAQELL